MCAIIDPILYWSQDKRCHSPFLGQNLSTLGYWQLGGKTFCCVSHLASRIHHAGTQELGKNFSQVSIARGKRDTHPIKTAAKPTLHQPIGRQHVH